MKTPVVTDETRRLFAPHGRLRVGLALGSTISAVWSMRDAKTGAPSGPAVDLGSALAAWLELDRALVPLASSGQIVDLADHDRWDIAFIPVDAERKKKVDLTTNYALGDSTCMVRSGSPFLGVADLNRQDVCVVGVKDTATFRSARKLLPQAQFVAAEGLDEALAAFQSGDADVVALGRESLLRIQATLPHTRILSDYLHRTGTALAMPRGRGAAIEIATSFVEEAKQDGTIRDILARHRLPAAAIAPPMSRS